MGPSRNDLRRIVIAYAVAVACVMGAMGANALSLTSLLKPTPVNVGYAGDPTDLLKTVLSLGGTVEARDDALRVVTVDTLDPLGLITLLTSRLDVRYAQADGAVAPMDAWASGTRWSSTTAEATRWSSTDASATRWSGDDWSATRWSDTGWDATRWSGTGWDATRWSGTASDGSTASFTGMDPGVPYQWGLGAINAPGAWQTTVGTHDRIICVIDSGVDWTHPDLAPNMWTASDGSHGYNFLNKSAWPMDDAGHGTHVAGIAAAVSGNGLGIAGVAQERIMAVKVLDSTGAGRESHAAFALQWCADHGANVASLSLGTDKDKMVLRDGVLYAQLRGMLVVAAAGNDGCSCARYPAAYSGVLAVASFDKNGTHSPFSNRGSWIALSAPGENITSTYAGGGYRVGSGTSQATPFVAGAAALAWGANTQLSASSIASILRSTAWDLGAPGKDDLFGYGGVDAHRALDAALNYHE